MNTLADFKVGQKVVATDAHWNDTVRRTAGTVVSVDNHVGVVFPKDTKLSKNAVIYSDPYELIITPEPKTEAPETKSLFPADAKARKEIPLASGVLDYFTSALIEVAKVSFEGNKQHNPGQPLHWARGKSTDQADTILRHFVERGTVDSDGIRHSAKLAWRALALLQLELEAEGAPLARGAKL